MTAEDRLQWDERYTRAGSAPADDRPGPPPRLAAFEHLFPTAGSALELACGRGQGVVWLASRGMTAWGVDVSPVAIASARRLAHRHGVSSRCRFDVVDLDGGLPPGPPVDLVLCHRFRDPRLDPAVVGRLAPGGLLAIVVLSEVDAGPGSFRVRPGALLTAFAALEVVAHGEGGGEAWLVARAPA